ncbi:LacI family transcriptional regulator [Devosia limi DSM 17137]|uniref:LacI family transcriptional regulator n=1 Tax=Devosia limi DSM 17137 TaxID=1121477 RepID=A0A0F5LWE7_9HYPH|nr:LacI family DNA-binding transcriptional regulator [Devosia limi]KKB86601.1 LacI family transcriptional regulator [Devosia limi DSM 17137]SHF65823.1 transcriptional regulator, LacI family [Devosia limi DSM 17137]
MAGKSVKLADVAKAAGVSQGTASNVFSRPNLVRDEVRERVLAAAKALGYGGPDLKGRLLRAGKVNAIGVAAVEPMSYFFDDPWARALMAAIARVCDASGSGIALVSAMNHERLAWNIQSALVDGFILLCVEGGEELVQLTRERQLPFVALALGVQDRSIPAIGIDNVSGGALAARHLTDLGHRKFAVLATEFNADDHVGLVSAADVAGAIYATSRDRVTGYRQALAAVGLGPEDLPVYETRNDKASVEACLARIFAGGEGPTALLAMSDRIALYALDWLKARGLQVPGDVSIVGFDGVPEAQASTPALTTIVQPMAEIARVAVHAILENAVPSERRTLPVTLAVRASTAPPAA